MLWVLRTPPPESEDEIIEDMEQVAADMTNGIELKKTVKDEESIK